jgi:hypothetical protein
MPLLEAVAMAWLLCFFRVVPGKRGFVFIKTLELDWTIKACS